jgi:non-ribosomal peptide synthetase component E (peptide arylation enzyme)
VAAICRQKLVPPGLRRIGAPADEQHRCLPCTIFALTPCLLAIRQPVPDLDPIRATSRLMEVPPFHLLPAVAPAQRAVAASPVQVVDFRMCLSQVVAAWRPPREPPAWQQTTGCAMVEGWGMSETCAIGTNNIVTSREFTGTIGLPLPGIEIDIKDDQSASMPLGQPGEICIKGPNVMRGYYKQPAETEKAFTPDGFMRTGDIGTMDERGYTTIVDRKKDMINVSGFNVFPNELENVVSLCPGVVECAAIGVADEKQGEAIKIFIVRNDPTLSEEDVAKFCRQNLTGYKVPKYIDFRDELPKTNVGKILRRELRTAKH